MILPLPYYSHVVTSTRGWPRLELGDVSTNSIVSPLKCCQLLLSRYKLCVCTCEINTILQYIHT